MKIVALYKSYDGAEWLPASLASVYPHVSHIVAVDSEISWCGERANTTRPVLRAWKRDRDPDGKLTLLECGIDKQAEQYRIGIDWIRVNIPDCDYIMLIDADEIWESAALERARLNLEQGQGPAYMTGLWEYIKTPFYRMLPSVCRPTVFVKMTALDGGLLGARGEQMPGKRLIDVRYHHFTAVRRNVEEVLRKFRQSAAGDDRESVTDLDKWQYNKWNPLPHSIDLHPFVGRHALWEKVECVWLDSLPDAVRNSDAFGSYLPAGEILTDEAPVLFRAVSGREHVVNLGTLLGHSAVILALGAKQVTAVDTFTHKSGHKPTPERHLGELATCGNYFEAVRDSLVPYYGNIRCLCMDSAVAAGQFNDGSIDGVFMDASHTFDGVMRDWVAWRPKLVPGALVILHDYNEAHPGVVAAAAEMVKAGAVDASAEHKACGSLKVVRKR